MRAAPSTRTLSLGGKLLCAVIASVIAFVVVGQIAIQNFWIGSAFLALRFPIALVAAAAIGIATKTKSTLVRRVLLVLLTIAVGSIVSDKIVQPQSDSIAASAHTQDFRVTTYNLLLNNHRTSKTIDILTRKKANVLLLQEVTPRHQRDLGPKLRKRFPFQQWKARHGAFGTAILSTRPLSRNRVHVGAKDLQFAQCGTVDVDDTTVRVCSLHLLSPAAAFPPAASARFLSKLGNVADVRATQSEALLATLKREEKEVDAMVIAGDFNTLSFEPVYRMWRRSFVDAYRQKSSFSVGGTWPHGVTRGFFSTLGPVARIDYVFTSENLDVIDVEILGPAASDHAAVSALLRLPK